MNSIVNFHREKALSAFRNAMQAAEASLRTTKSPTNREEHELVDLAELHVISCETQKAESEFKQALDIFYKKADKESVSYIAYILKSLSGIYISLGRKKEAKDALNNALIWEEKLRETSK